jgi:hypothetical protein
MSFSRLLLRAVFKNSLTLGCSENGDLNEHRFRVRTSFVNNLHGRSRDDLPLPDGAGIETRRPSCEHHPSSGSGRQAI